MKKRFTYVIFSFVLALAMLTPMLPKASADCGCSSNVSAGTSADVNLSFADRVNLQVLVLSDTIMNAELVLGSARVMQLSSALLGIPVAQLELERSLFPVSASTFITAQIIARSLNIPVARIVQMLGGNPNFGVIAEALGLPQAVTLSRIGGFLVVFNNEIGIANGSSSSSCPQVTVCDQELQILIAALELLINKLDDLSVQAGKNAVQAATIESLRLELSGSPDMEIFISSISGATISRDGRFGRFGLIPFFLTASSIAAATGQSLEDVLANEFGLVGFRFENIDRITPYGAARALSANGIPVQVMVSRIDTFQQLVSGMVISANAN